jgi:mono/diheme cytochrome c family protein
MLDVVNNSTPYLTDEDIGAMAAFLKSLAATTQQQAFVYRDAPTELLSGKPQQPGAAVYLGFCAPCHRIDGKGQAPFMPPLAGNPAVLDPNPSSLINLVLNGAEPLVAKGIPDAYRMPQYRIQLNDEQIAHALGAPPATSVAPRRGRHAAIVVLIAVLRHGATALRMRELTEVIGVDRKLREYVVHALQKAGAVKLMTPELIATLCDHAQGNPRALMNIAGELLAVAAEREARQIDEKLFLETCTTPPVAEPKTAGRRR